MDKVKAPGLKWRRLAGGVTPVWVADETDIKAGYRPKTVNLSFMADQPEMLAAKCAALQADMLLWRTGHRRDPLAFEGTVLSLLSIYQRHPDSPFHGLTPGTQKPYKFYIAKLEGHIGPRRIDRINGVDIRHWHKVWSKDGKHLAAAAMARAVFDGALSFGIQLRLPGCADLAVISREARKRLPTPSPREAVITADQVVALRAAAHARGAPSRALAYAVAFEAAIRLWDVIGQWWPIEREGVSDVVDPKRGQKWFGLRWEDINADGILRFTPSKTSRTTGKAVAYRLSNAPMVQEEMVHWPEEQRRGPMIVWEKTGLPYADARFTSNFAADRKKAGLPTDLWARDLRASGITEGRDADASTDDAAKIAGHSNNRTTSRVYDRAVLQAGDRFAEARRKAREQSGNGGGHAR